MLNKISKRLAKLLAKKTQSDQHQEDVYTYGLELIISTTLGFLSIIFLSTVLQELASGIVFIFFFSSLRIFVGGYHANTYGKCFIISNIAYLVVLLIKEIIWKYASHNILFLGLFAIAIYFIKKAPIINEKQCISYEKQLRNRKMTRFILIIQFILISCLSNIHRELMCMAVLSVYLVALFMLISDKPMTVYNHERRVK